MPTYESFHKLLSGFDRSTDHKAIEQALFEFGASSGYAINTVEFYFQLGKSKIFTLHFADECEAVSFATAFSPLSGEHPPLDVERAIVSVRVT